MTNNPVFMTDLTLLKHGMSYNEGSRVQTNERDKRMFLATRKVRVQYGMKRDFIEAWHNAIGARLKRQPGFITAWLLTSPNDDEIMVMSQWETEADHTAWRTSDTYRQVQSHIGRMLRNRVGDKNYWVVAEVRTP
jgi:heme-degrading monooxygenase HmoA